MVKKIVAPFDDGDFLIPHTISSEMEDDSVPEELVEKNDDGDDSDIQSIIRERLKSLTKNPTNPTAIIGALQKSATNDKTNVKFGTTDLISVLDYIKNNKGSITIKIEF